MEAGLSLGSNEGDRIARLRDARQRILAIPGITELARSPLYETEPVDVKPEFKDMKFINAVLIVEADLIPREWLAHAEERYPAIAARLSRMLLSPIAAQLNKEHPARPAKLLIVAEGWLQYVPSAFYVGLTRYSPPAARYPCRLILLRKDP